MTTMMPLGKSLRRGALSMMGLFFTLHLNAHEAFSDNPLSEARELIDRGQIAMARSTLFNALQKEDSPPKTAFIEGELGLVELRLRDSENGKIHLQHALSQKAGTQGDQFRWSLALAHQLTNETPPPPETNRYLNKARELAGHDDSLKIRLALTEASFLVKQEPEHLSKTLTSLAQQINERPSSKERASFHIVLAKTAKDISQWLPKEAESLKAVRFRSLNQAIDDAGDIVRLKLESYLELAALYQEDQRPEDAIQLLARGIREDEKQEAPDLLWQMRFQEGLLLNQLGKLSEALDVLQKATENLALVRSDLPTERKNGKAWFTEYVEPLYMTLADLLLIRSSDSSLPAQSQRDLRVRVIYALEEINRADLDDFLGHRCGLGTDKNKSSDVFRFRQKDLAILYPIAFKDRLELLLIKGDMIHQATVRGIHQRALSGRVDAFLHALNRPDSHPGTLGRELFDWLIKPLHQELLGSQIRHLVIVPDKILRKIPFSALQDENGFLIEQLSVSTLTGLTLFDPLPDVSSGSQDYLLAGVSRPGSAVDHLPENLKGEMIRNVKSTSEIDRGSLLKDRLALPGVEREVKGIETQDTKVLMNQDFTLAALKEALHRHAYTALHIASHGFIGKTSDQSFVIAYDNVINFNDLYSVLLEAQRHSSPLKLLTLSACHTAEGDDRTPLGLSGMAIRAKVSSALGSLWPVDDNATAQLMPLFYRELQSNEGHTAKALRAAQMAMIKEPRYQHPYYWAAFTLVGQWW